MALRSTKILPKSDGSVLSEESTNRTRPVCGGLNQILEERDACGVGVIASLKGERTHKCVDDSLSALGCMEHRGACSADNDSSGGAGCHITNPVADVIKWCAANGISGFSEESSRCFHDPSCRPIRAKEPRRRRSLRKPSRLKV